MGSVRWWCVVAVVCVAAACGEVKASFVDAAASDAAAGDGPVACDDRACSPMVDSCCPTACNASNDLDCAAICGNGMLEPGERCDPLANCPTRCAAQGCNLFTLEQPGTCFAQCAPAGAQQQCQNGDDCCATGCNANSDGDCAPVCGNGEVERGEACEGAGCPTRCPQVGCQLRALQGTGCQVTCENTGLQDQCASGDGCCPAGCNSVNDTDCQPGCGNGVVEANETCDPLNTCPTSCASNGCQLRTVENPGTCQAACVDGGQQTACANNDGCCPTGCDAITDNDCAAACNNGVVEPGETCDPPGSCPTCSETQTCYTTSGSAQTCNLRCHVPVTTCGINDDSCCAFDPNGGCGSGNDRECSGARWEEMEWPNPVDYTAGLDRCWTDQIYGIDPFGSYLFTLCQPSASPGGDPVITSVRDNAQRAYNVSNDDCSDSTALPRLINWQCQNSAGALTMSCASMSPGGFKPMDEQVFMLEITVCPYNAAPTSAGRAPLHIFFNARQPPHQG